MRPTLVLLVSASWLLAQDPAKPATPAAAPAASDSSLHFSSDVGYRILTGQHGSFNTYRSIINLGEGPRLLQFQSSYKREGKWLDEFRLVGSNWGDPLNSLQFSADKASLYRLQVSYRNLAYFNALPSFASPQLPKLGTEALTTNQNSYDTRQRFWNVDLDMRPGKALQPFFGIAQNTNLGQGVSPFVLDENSYPAASRVDSRYTLFRGGLRIEKDWMHLNLEQGGATFFDDNFLLNSASNLGNRESPYLGRQLSVQNAKRLYSVNGNHIYSSANLMVSPLSWLDVGAEFYYSRPRSDVRFDETAQGTLLRLETIRFINGQQSVGTGYANQPRTAGGATLEVRPVSRLRLLEAWQTEQTHNAGSLSLLTTLDARQLPTVNLSDRLVWKQQEQRLQAFYDVTKQLTVFAGHRYLWGEAEVRRASLAPGAGLERGLLRRNSGLAGFVFRPMAKLTLNGETEVGRGSQTYFRTSLQNFEQVRLRARYQLSDAWQFSARVASLQNANPTPGIQLAYRTQQANVTVQWTQKAVSVIGDYTRSGIRSDLQYLDPVYYTPIRSLYRDNAHSGTLAADFRMPRKASLALGGSLFRSTGSRASRYYQPLVRLRVPLTPHAGFLAEWRNTSYGQTLYAYEAFGVQQFTVGLQLHR